MRDMMGKYPMHIYGTVTDIIANHRTVIQSLTTHRAVIDISYTWGCYKY